MIALLSVGCMRKRLKYPSVAFPSARSTMWAFDTEKDYISHCAPRQATLGYFRLLQMHHKKTIRKSSRVHIRCCEMSSSRGSSNRSSSSSRSSSSRRERLVETTRVATICAHATAHDDARAWPRQGSWVPPRMASTAFLTT